MKIKAIEPTPSPNTMKVILNEVLPSGARNNYTNENKEQAPMQVQEILKIEGIKGVYHVADFLAVERNAKYDWKVLLQQVRAVFGEEVVEESEEQQLAHFGGSESVCSNVLYNSNASKVNRWNDGRTCWFT